MTVVVVVTRPERADLDGPSSADGPDDDRASGAGALVERIQAALRHQDEEAAARLGGSDEATRLLTVMVDNVETLDLDRITLRYIDESDTSLSSARQGRYAPDAWVADVQLTWRLRGRDPAPSTVEVPFVITAGQDALFLDVLVDPSYRVPMWVTGPVAVGESPRVLVEARSPAEARRLGRQAVVAVRTVNRSLPAWRGPLIVEAPGTAVAFSAASGLPRDQARGIAAVTTTTEPPGSPRPSVHVFLNPRVFRPLGPRGQQIVLAHEATHVAVGAADTSLPLWLSEGYADYVALRHSPLPATVLGAQIMALVRRDGVPDRLPGAAELAGNNPDVGAWYESAWLAVDLMGDRYGAERVHRFYRTSDSESPRRAFSSVLGTTEAAFTREWQARLDELAG